MPGARLTSPLGNAGASRARARATVGTDRAPRGLAPETVLAARREPPDPGHAPVAGRPTSPAWATWAPLAPSGRAPQGLPGSPVGSLEAPVAMGWRWFTSLCPIQLPAPSRGPPRRTSQLPAPSESASPRTSPQTAWTRGSSPDTLAPESALRTNSGRS